MHGSGKRRFADGTVPRGLKLTNSTTASGVMITRYERAGDVAYGTFALEQPTEAETERRRHLND